MTILRFVLYDNQNILKMTLSNPQWEVTFWNGGFEGKTFHQPKVNMTTFYNGIWKTGFSTRMSKCSNFPEYPGISQWNAPLKSGRYWMYRCTFPQLKLNVSDIQTPYRYQQMHIDITLNSVPVSTLIIEFLGYFNYGICNLDGILK